MEIATIRDMCGPRPRNNRSKVSNGTKLFIEALDGRTALGRRFKDLLADIAEDLGGREVLSEGQRQLIRRAGMLSFAAARQPPTILISKAGRKQAHPTHHSPTPISSADFPAPSGSAAMMVSAASPDRRSAP